MKISLNFAFVMFANQKNADNMHISFGGIAQLVERLHGMQEVSGSIPLTSTIHRRVCRGLVTVATSR